MSKTILLTLCLLIATSTYGRRTIDTYFFSAPAQLLPQLSENSRKDLIDLHDAGHDSRITGTLGDTIKINTIDDCQISIQLSSASTLQIALLPDADTVRVIAVVHTVNLPAPDSRIAFYDSNWRPIATDRLFTPPTAEAFLDKGSKKEKRAAAAIIDMLPVSYTIEGNTLLARESLQEYLPEEIYNRIAPQLSKQPVSYNWNGKRFTR